MWLFAPLLLTFLVPSVQSQATWLSGNSTGDVYGVYGTRGEPSINNYPGGRRDQTMVLDETTNSLYLFGGYGLAANGSGDYSFFLVHFGTHYFIIRRGLFE
jgi:hypothetical protein